MKASRSLAGALILALSVLPGQAFEPEGDDYLCETSHALSYFNHSRWFSDELPLKVHIPALPYPVENPGLYPETVRQAFAEWTAIVPELRLQYVANPRDAQIKIKWIDHFPESEAIWGNAVYPQPYFDGQRRLRHRAEVHLPLKHQPGTMTPGQAPFFDPELLLAIARHQTGHTLGLPHSGQPGDIMSSHLFRFSALQTLKLSSRDGATLRRLYTLPTRLQASPCNG